MSMRGVRLHASCLGSEEAGGGKQETRLIQPKEPLERGAQTLYYDWTSDVWTSDWRNGPQINLRAGRV